jgi:hypothetical protein
LARSGSPRCPHASSLSLSLLAILLPAVALILLIMCGWVLVRLIRAVRVRRRRKRDAAVSPPAPA